MAGRMDTILKVCEILCEAKNMRIYSKINNTEDNYYSNYGMLYGNVGFLSNSMTTGSSIATEIKSFQKILKEDLTYRQKVYLTNQLEKILTHIQMSDARKMAATISRQPELNASVTNIITDYLSQNLRFQYV